MLSPTPAEWQIYRRVSTWLADNLAAAIIDAQIQAAKVTSHIGDNPLAIFDRFPNGAKMRTLVAGSRAFGRLSQEISRNNPTIPGRIAAWKELGILAKLVPSKNGLYLTLL